MGTALKKDKTRRFDELPDIATWDDLMHEIFVRQAVEAGLEDSREGRVQSVDEVRGKYGLPPICG